MIKKHDLKVQFKSAIRKFDQQAQLTSAIEKHDSKVRLSCESKVRKFISLQSLKVHEFESLR